MVRNFKKQQFRKTETKQLIDRKIIDSDNWLPQPKDEEPKHDLGSKRSKEHLDCSMLSNW